MHKFLHLLKKVMNKPKIMLLLLPILLLCLVIRHNKFTYGIYLNHAVSNEYPPSVILWTSWRSGSTFLGELLHNAHNDTFYDYEPMLPFGVKIFRDANKETEDARRYLNSLLRCNMTTHKQTTLKLTGHGVYRMHNNFLSAECNKPGIDCQNTTVISNICKSAKYHAVKVLRLSLVWAHSLLSDPTLDTKIIYLVRDPRPVIRSRSSLKWCHAKDCSDPVRVCGHLIQDLTAARELKSAYPDNFHLIRYEDLSLDVLGTVEKLWKRLDFKLTKEQSENIKKLTTDEGEPKNPYQVSQNSAAHTFSWRESMEYKKMRKVQDACVDVLDILGLRSFQSKEDYMNYSLPIITKTAQQIEAWLASNYSV